MNTNSAQWTPEKAAIRAQERKEAQIAAKAAKAADPRSDIQKARDVKREAQERSNAMKGLSLLPNAAGDPLALAASLTKSMFDKCQPAWKTDPVAPAPPKNPLAVRERTWVVAEISPDPKGEDGAQGDTGPTGTGITGPRGSTGPTGTGVTGPRGSTGPSGRGSTGPTGPRGPTGTGYTGPTGPRGSTGPMGSVGPVGPTGPSSSCAGYLEDAPNDGNIYARQSGAWVVIGP